MRGIFNAVAAVPPPPPKIDGDYRATMPANTLGGIGPFEVYISVRSGIVSGYAQPNSLIDIACSSGGFSQSNIRATGKFEPEPGATDVVAGRVSAWPAGQAATCSGSAERHGVREA